MAAMQSRGVAIDRAAASIGFSFAVGSNYFFQIAKLRAFRVVWAQVVESFGGACENASAHIHARTSRWNKTIYDPHVNVLRATTEAMSAILGGADSITVAAFDECYRAPDEASRRLARNTQIVLKQEALLAMVADPGAGSYCLETITDFLAREAWKSMQQVESAGGFQKAVAGGLIAQALDRSRTAKESAIASRRRVLTGTNQYANPAERALGRIELEVDSQRGAAPYEALRLRTERSAAKTGRLPRVLLAEIGDARMRAARSNFAANFFACAGFEVQTKRFDTPEQIAACDAGLMVLCSADTEYLALATGLIASLKKLGKQTLVLIAGRPESAEQLKAAGVADFIHVRSNPIEVLTKWQRQMGIEE